MVERGGTKISSLLCRSEPWDGQECWKEDCFPCTSLGEERKLSCTHEGALYLLTCVTCKEKGIKSEYWGETGRNCYTRGLEHQEGWKRKVEDNPLTKHWTANHQGEAQEPKFSMAVKRKFLKALQRQVAEAVAIGNSGADIILNSKSEWNSQPIPRVITETANKTSQHDHQGRIQKRMRINPAPGQDETICAPPRGWQNNTQEGLETITSPE